MGLERSPIYRDYPVPDAKIVSSFTSISSIMDFGELRTSREYVDDSDDICTFGHEYPSDDFLERVYLQNDIYYGKSTKSKEAINDMHRAAKSQLFDALNNPAEVQRLITEGADVNYEDFLGATPLHWVFSRENPNLESAEVIHQNGGNINSQDYQGNTPLEYAVRHAKSVAGVKWLLANGADPNVKTKQNLLLYASSQNKTAMLRMLLEAGADPNTPRHFPPLFSALGLGTLVNETVDLLLEHGANPVAQTNGIMTPLAYAARHGNSSGRLSAIRKVYKEAQRRGTPYTAEQLSKALSEYRGTSYPRDFFEQFLEWNVDANQKITRPNGGFTRPLIIACGDENVDVDAIRYLLRMGADPTLADQDGDTPLHAAIHTGAPDTVLFLLEVLDAQVIDQVNKHGQTALHFACGIFHPDAFNVYRMKNFNQGLGFSPSGGYGGPEDLPEELFEDLMIREFKGWGMSQYMFDDQPISHRREIQNARRANLTQALLSKGASPYAQDSVKGATPLHYACRLGVPEVVTVLLEGCSGKCLESKDNQGQTPLHWAAKWGKDGARAIMEWSQTEQVILDDEGPYYGRDLPSMVDDHGRLPLHLAAREGRDAALEVLLEYTPVTLLEAEDLDGRTPSWYAGYWHTEDDFHGCEIYRSDNCWEKLQRKIESTRGIGHRHYYAFAAVVSLLALVVIFRSAIAGAAVAVVAWGRGLYVKSWRGGEIGWQGAMVAWRYAKVGAVAGWLSMREEYNKSHGQ
ncbi:putative ankyrin repeat protein [Trichoderma evansii]